MHSTRVSAKRKFVTICGAALVVSTLRDLVAVTLRRWSAIRLQQTLFVVVRSKDCLVYYFSVAKGATEKINTAKYT